MYGGENAPSDAFWSIFTGIGEAWRLLGAQPIPAMNRSTASHRKFVRKRFTDTYIDWAMCVL
jgi:hypothetical protein